MHNHERAALWVRAEDDCGGMYLDSFGGSSGRASLKELALQFRPRLDPLAQALTLTFTGASGRSPLSSTDNQPSNRQLM